MDLSEQGRNLGSNVLRDGIARSVEAAEIVRVRALLVHVLNERARVFYQQHDFEPSPTDSLRLMLLVKDACKVLRRHQ